MRKRTESNRLAADIKQLDENFNNREYEERLEEARAQQARAVSLTFGGGFGQLRRLG